MHFVLSNLFSYALLTRSLGLNCEIIQSWSPVSSLDELGEKARELINDVSNEKVKGVARLYKLYIFG